MLDSHDSGDLTWGRRCWLPLYHGSLTMKHLVAVATILFGFSLFADTAQRAEELYGQRGENIKNALMATKIYHQLAKQESAQEAKAEFLIRESEASYYVGGYWDKRKYKLTAYSQGLEAAETVVEMFAEPANPRQKEFKARGLYWYGVNLGKYGQTKGIFASTRNTPKLEETMNTIIDMGYGDIYSYGAYRVLGRLADRTPGIFGGSKKKARKYLAKAFENTLLEDAGVSVHGLNNIYYAEALMEGDSIAFTFKSRSEIILEIINNKKACGILASFVQQNPTTLLKTRSAETVAEMAKAEKLLLGEDCW